MKPVLSLSLLSAALLAAGCGSSQVTNQAGANASTNPPSATANSTTTNKVMKTDEEWKKELTPEQYRVLREKGTEASFSGAYWNTKDPGVYRCAGCGEVLFASDTKYDSGCGWPSFYAPTNSTVVATQTDRSLFMDRNEVLCAKCGGHLGHVFDDGPQPTGLRYCINSASLKFEKK